MGNRLRELRQGQRLSLRELGAKTNIAYTTIGAMEREDRPFTQANLEVLCKFFNVSSDYLLGLSDVRENVAINNFTEHLEGIDIEILKDIKSLNDKAKEDLKTILQYLKSKGEL